MPKRVLVQEVVRLSPVSTKLQIDAPADKRWGVSFCFVSERGWGDGRQPASTKLKPASTVPRVAVVDNLALLTLLFRNNGER